MSDPSNDPSVQFEPHFAPLLGGSAPSPPSPSDVESAAVEEPSSPEVDHTVWDEPTLSSELSGTAGAGQLTYARWLDERIAATSFAKSALVTLLVALAAGPFGVFGALFGSLSGIGPGGFSAAGLIAVCVVGPVTEEIMKIALAMWIVEKRPYLFKAIWQILLAAAAGGVFFGAIENLIYLNVYIPDPSASLIRWRWTVCMGLHSNCSFVAGVGLARIWDHAIRNRVPPQLGKGMPWFATAMIGHGLYNFTAAVGEMSGWLKLGE
jgi:RsiW-degrading membrane proteinase PrsW (M82 family)